MSSLNLKILARVAAGGRSPLSACPPAFGRSTVSDRHPASRSRRCCASIDVPEVQWPPALANTGHYLRSEMIYALNGSGSDTPKRYALTMTAGRRYQSSPVIDTPDRRAELGDPRAAPLTYTTDQPSTGRPWSLKALRPSSRQLRPLLAALRQYPCQPRCGDQARQGSGRSRCAPGSSAVLANS